MCSKAARTNFFDIPLDVCSVNNGGCDINSECSHAPGSDVCTCKCKAGFTNTATTGPVVCKGNPFCVKINCVWQLKYKLLHFLTDVCSVNNGGCDINADCSHAVGSDACICKCKSGFTNTAATGPVVCKGNATQVENFDVRIQSFPIVFWRKTNNDRSCSIRVE